jgi:UDP-glucose:(heptosyl)LPS alpha-1,3-glucosyltransferase
LRRVSETGPWDIVKSYSRLIPAPAVRASAGSHRAYLGRVRPYRKSAARLLERFSPKNSYYQRLEQALYTREDVFIIANSQGTREELVATYQVPENRISVIYPGVDLQRFDPAKLLLYREDYRARWQISPSEFVIVFVGSGFFRKGLEFGLKIVANLARRDSRLAIKFLIAGRGKVRSYQRLAARLGIGDQVRFLGNIEEIPQLLAASDVFLLPSLYEPFGISPLEAMAAGLPIIISRSSGLAELLEDNREALLLDRPDQIEYAADFLEELAHNVELRTKMGAAGRRTACLRAQDRYCKELLGVYDRLTLIT